MISIPLWLVLAVSMIFITIGMRCLYKGRRGRLIHDHPLCANCDYDLNGQPADSARCPECGESTVQENGVRIGAYQKRPFFLVAGNLLLLSGIALVICWSLGLGRSINWIAIKPASWLAIDAEKAGATFSNSSLEELNRRLSKGELSAASARNIVERALRIQGDVAAAWHAGWGDFIEAARGRNFVTNKQWVSYAEQAIKLAFKFNIRKRVIHGEPIPATLQIADFKGASNSVLRAEIELVNDFKVGDAIFGMNAKTSSISQLNTVAGLQGGLRTAKITAMSIPNSVDTNLLAPGRWPATTIVGVTVWEGSGDSVDKTSILFKEQISLVEEVEILPADRSAVLLVTAKGRKPQQEFWIELRKPDSDGVHRIELWVRSPSLPVDIAYEVFLVIKGQEYHVGSIAMARTTQPTNNSWTLDLPDSVQPQNGETDMILRPSMDVAKKQVDVIEIWGEVIEIKNVRVIAAKH